MVSLAVTVTVRRLKVVGRETLASPNAGLNRWSHGFDANKSTDRPGMTPADAAALSSGHVSLIRDQTIHVASYSRQSGDLL